MSDSNSVSSKTLPLHERHQACGAHFGTFGGWTVPLYYTSILEEHEAVRTGTGIFDVSHMGEFDVEGKDAGKVINRWITNDLSKISPGQAIYSPVCFENGGIVDDVIVYLFHPEKFMIVVNASNIEKDFNWFRSHLVGEVKLTDQSSQIALLAIQGPKSRDLMAQVLSIDLSGLSYYHFTSLESRFGSITVSATGYTGEEGFELFCPVGQVKQLWDELFRIGNSFGLKPVGFGARDTLRLEVKNLLYGHEMSAETTPLEAGLGWTIGWTKEEFIGKTALVAQREKGISKKLVGFELLDRGIAREGYAIKIGSQVIGQVTSGTFSPSLKKNISLGYVDVMHSKIGQEISIEIRGRNTRAQIIKTPFYQGGRSAKQVKI